MSNSEDEDNPAIEEAIGHLFRVARAEADGGRFDGLSVIAVVVLGDCAYMRIAGAKDEFIFRTVADMMTDYANGETLGYEEFAVEAMN